MSGKAPIKLDKEKVLANAVISIQLGVEDYQISTSDGGNPLRAISSARNLFAGVLLLFKYKIASLASSPEHAATLIYKARKFRPYVTDAGGTEWRPELEKITIDTAGIESHFVGLGIQTDWEVVKRLQLCRNDLEHLHPKHPVEDINRFLLDLFPLLRDFITNEVGENPAALLEGTWEVMLQNHEFFTRNLVEARVKWSEIGVLGHTLEIFRTCICPNCGSPLLEPNREDVLSNADFNDLEYRYSCIACDHSDSFIELLTEELQVSRENSYDEEPVIIECENCWHITFDLSEGICHLCNYQHRAPMCGGCNRPLEGYEAENGTLCDRCYEFTHNDEYEPHIR